MKFPVRYFFYIIVFLGGSIPALADVSAKAPENTPSPEIQKLIDHALAPRITCDAPPAVYSSQQRKAEEALFELPEFKAFEKANKNTDELKFLPWSVPALGVQFEKVFIWWKATMAWSRLAQVEELSKALQDKGFHPLFPEEFDKKWKDLPSSIKKWGFERLTPSWHWKILIVEGQIPVGGKSPAPGGISLICGVDETENDVALAKLGLPSSKELEDLLQHGKEIPPQWGEQILETKNSDLLPILARYYYFTKNQVQNLLKHENFFVDRALIFNEKILLHEDELNTLLERRWKEHLFGPLIRSRGKDLNTMQRAMICSTSDRHPDCDKLK